MNQHITQIDMHQVYFQNLKLWTVVFFLLQNLNLGSICASDDCISLIPFKLRTTKERVLFASITKEIQIIQEKLQKSFLEVEL